MVAAAFKDDDASSEAELDIDVHPLCPTTTLPIDENVEIDDGGLSMSWPSQEPAFSGKLLSQQEVGMGVAQLTFGHLLLANLLKELAGYCCRPSDDLQTPSHSAIFFS